MDEANLDAIDRDIVDWTIEHHPLGVLITAGENHPEHEQNDILYVNRAFEEMTGYSKADVVGEKPKLLQGPKTHEQLKDYMAERLAAGEHFIGETVNYRKDGSEYRVRLSLDPIERDAGITHCVSIQQDVSRDPLSLGFVRK